MIFRQVIHDDLGCASYLIGDDDAGVAAVVDPRLDVGEYLRLARYLDVEIEHVLETHNHADHVSGHERLTGAERHTSFDDGEELALGRLGDCAAGYRLIRSTLRRGRRRETYVRHLRRLLRAAHY